MEKYTENGAGRRIAFTIEILALLAVFTAVLVVLVNGFALAGRLGRESKALSNAVYLAENAAEMAAAASSGEMLFQMLNENGNAVVRGADGVYCAKYDAEKKPAADGIYSVDVSWEPEADGIVKSTVAVYVNNGAEPVYSLELSLYAPEGGA